MKAFTNLEQSKKLAEFLSPESADMWYGNEDSYKISVGKWKDNEHDEDDIPCWSLNSLIDILPDTITDKDGTIFGLNIKKNFIEYYNPSMGALYATYHSIIAEDLVDACYEMIIYLNELKML